MLHVTLMPRNRATVIARGNAARESHIVSSPARHFSPGSKLYIGYASRSEWRAAVLSKFSETAVEIASPPQPDLAQG